MPNHKDPFSSEDEVRLRDAEEEATARAEWEASQPASEAAAKDAQERAAWLREAGEPPQELLRLEPGAPFATIEQAAEVLRQTLISLDAKSKALAEVSEERRAEWIRAERAEVERDAALARVAALEAALRVLAESRLMVLPGRVRCQECLRRDMDHTDVCPAGAALALLGEGQE